MMLSPGSGSTYDNLLTCTPPFLPDNAHFMVGAVTIPPGDPGSGPHRHSGPVFGYHLRHPSARRTA
ncbi:hypothetical protein ACWEOE_32535 [Amycolatopsis sp. NPDC004368]